MRKTLSKIKAVVNKIKQWLFLVSLFYSKDRYLVQSFTIREQELICPEAITSRISTANRKKLIDYLKQHVSRKLNAEHKLRGLKLPVDLRPYQEAYAPDSELLYKALEQRIEQNLAWEETEWYQKCVKTVANGKPIWNGCKDTADIKNACMRADKLIESIKQKGFVKNNHPVNVARTSNTYCKIGNGQHRIMIAKILNQKLWVRVVFEV